jgi:DNA-binding MarR family transcriptional regulator
VRLTEAGARAQREIGRAHGRHVAEAMTKSLSRRELLQLRDLCRALVSS